MDNFKETVPAGYSKADADLNFSNYECIHKIWHSSQTNSQHRMEEGSYVIPELFLFGRC